MEVAEQPLVDEGDAKPGMVKRAWRWVTTPWRLFKAKYINKETIIVWNVSSWVTILQLAFLQKAWAWATVKWPVFTSLAAKAGIAVKAFAIKVWETLVAIFLAIATLVKEAFGY